MTSKPYSHNMFDVAPGDYVAMRNKHGMEIRQKVRRVSDKSIWASDHTSFVDHVPTFDDYAWRTSWGTFNRCAVTMRLFSVMRGTAVIVSFSDGVRVDGVRDDRR